MEKYPEVSKKFSSRVKKYGLRSKLKMFLAVIFSILVMISFFGGELGFFRMWVLSRRADRLEHDIRLLNVQRMDILWESAKMRNDPDYILRYAVRNFGYARPDQKVIQFVQTKTKKPAHVAPTNSKVTD